MKHWSCEPGFEERLLESIRLDFPVFGPVASPDGVTRLARVENWQEISTRTLPLIPVKKFLLPPKDVLWALEGDIFRRPSGPEPLALVGIPCCDLSALAYLDRVFADDRGYLKRRQKIFLVGTACRPDPGCFCPSWEEPPPFDLFLDGGRVWGGSIAGEDMLARVENYLSGCEEGPFPIVEVSGEGRPFPKDLEKSFASSFREDFWRETGERCLSCGACSAVCPTCYCYDVVDEAEAGGAVTRHREWDNCFFRNHGLVAGGHNFRPTRTDRLRFRFEHKLLGFGPLRGVPSCVGCGRCARACPVDIDISVLLDRLNAREVP